MKRGIVFITVATIIGIVSLTAMATEPGEWTTPSPVTSLGYSSTGAYTFEMGGLTDLLPGCSTSFKFFSPGASFEELRTLVMAAFLSGKNLSCQLDNNAGACLDEDTRVMACRIHK
ncbi:MAG: hypothetical protein GY854_02225 [Deltaproteobacteria bacterium]|nr:hypothetical protein [Deltaproteobacteria bacterium]